MTPTLDQIARVRAMTATTTADYPDAALISAIARYPLLDADGRKPTDAGWTPTYDLHAAAADVWEEIAARLASQYDFDADGARFARSQTHQHALAQARYHRARRAPMSRTVSREHDISLS